MTTTPNIIEPILTNVIGMLPDYGTVISIADYEKITGRDISANLDS